MPTKVIPINYTSREFNSIKNDLVQYAKRYYPDTFQDFNEASFGALMLDTVAYIGDVMSFYIDYQVNETFLDTAVEYNNIVRLGRQLGYKQSGYPSSFGLISLYLLVPANSTGLGPDLNYLPILQKSSIFGSAGGGTFSLLEDVDFSNSSVEVVVGKVNANTGVPTHYALKTVGKVVSGQNSLKQVAVAGFERFKRVRVGNSAISEIISVTDSDGNEYYEVEHLSQNVVYKSIINTNSDKDVVVNVLKPIIAPRRFTVERTGNSLFLQFGYGSDSELTTKSIHDPLNITLNMHGKDFSTDREFDPSKMLNTDKFGICPVNTTLNIKYRQNSPGRTSAPAGRINSVINSKFRFRNMDKITGANKKDVQTSLEVVNDEPITGGTPETTTTELKRRILGHFAAQNRAVTKQDYLALVNTMPAKYGFVKRCNIIRDPDSLKRNLNLYVVGENANGSLTAMTMTAKENLKAWLNTNRMINDSIDILDAKIVNFGISFSVKAHPSADKTAVLSRCQSALKRQYTGRNNLLDIAEPLYISKAYTILNRVKGVLDVKSVKILPKEGSLYSNSTFDFDDQRAPDGTYIAVPDNVILELKYPNMDIEGTVK
tara:strand:+ start:989 stop:2791 length:1803 start_codon:yes stop_codon:yes gene_type:complete